MKAIDITGHRFGRLTALRIIGRYQKSFIWICRCDCGLEKRVRIASLRSGETKSCGCLRRDRASSIARFIGRRHGHIKNGKRSAVYSSWENMIARCKRPSAPNYSYYGGRGIRIFEPWEKFENFLADMGERPADKTLDRIDPDGHYEPGNCRWATRKEQVENRRRKIA